jgi:hypothetical protein
MKTIRVREIAELLGVTTNEPARSSTGRASPLRSDARDRAACGNRREVKAWAKVWRREKPWR